MKTKYFLLFGIIFLLTINIASAWLFGPISPPSTAPGQPIAIANGTWMRFVTQANTANGSDGNLSRVIVVNNTQLSSNVAVVVDNYQYSPNADYTVVNNGVNSTITFLIPLYDSQIVQVDYLVASNLTYNIFETAFSSVSLNGSNGQTSRGLTLPNTGLTKFETVFVDNYVYIRNVDYSINNMANNSRITFNVPIYDDQRILVRYYVE